MFELMNELARRMDAGIAVYPPVNLWEDADRYVLEAELPGVKAEAVEVAVVDGVLSIKGARDAGAPEAGGFLRRERICGAFARSIELPPGVDSTAVQASLREGLLTVTLPKAEAAKPRRVPVKVGSES
jgi:HSP20 family protein